MSKDKKFVMTPADLRRHDEEMAAKTVCLVLATLMDEYSYDKEQLFAFSERFCRYNSAVSEHLLTIQKVSEIVKEQTGVNMKW